MKTIVAYQCDVCGAKYFERWKASECEASPVPKSLDIGAEISFEVESGIGGRWLYMTEGGKITDKQLVGSVDPHAQTFSHVWFYIVDTGEGEHSAFADERYKIVIEADGRLISPAEERRVAIGPTFAKDPTSATA